MMLKSYGCMINLPETKLKHLCFFFYSCSSCFGKPAPPLKGGWGDFYFKITDKCEFIIHPNLKKNQHKVLYFVIKYYFRKRFSLHEY